MTSISLTNVGNNLGNNTELVVSSREEVQCFTSDGKPTTLIKVVMVTKQKPQPTSTTVQGSQVISSLNSARGRPPMTVHINAPSTVSSAQFATVAKPVTSAQLAPVSLSQNMNKSVIGRRQQEKTIMCDEYQALIDALVPDDDMDTHIINLDKAKFIPYKLSGTENGYRRPAHRGMQCRYCGTSINNRHDFRKHIMTHPDINYKPWKCPLCDYKTSLKATIRKHINIHSTSKPFICSICSKGFSFRQKLQQHMKYHNDIRDFYCPDCPMSFHELKTLKTHIKHIHNHDNPSEYLRSHKEYRTPTSQHLSYKIQCGSTFRGQRPTNGSNDTAGPSSSPPQVQATSLLPCSQTIPEPVAYLEISTGRDHLTEPPQPGQDDLGSEDSELLPGRDEEIFEICPLVQEVKMEKLLAEEEAVGWVPGGDSGEDSPCGGLIELTPEEQGHGSEDMKAEESVNSLVSSHMTSELVNSQAFMSFDSDPGQDQLFCSVPEVLVEMEVCVEEVEPHHNGMRLTVQDSEPMNRLCDTHGMYVRMNRISSMAQIDSGMKDYLRIESADDAVWFVCTLCEHLDRSYRLYTHYTEHLLRDHPSLRPYKCQECGFLCRTKSNLISHSKKHKGDRRYQCTECTKSFLFSQKLKVHMRIHANHREHQCQGCDKSFNEKSELNRHFRKVHLRERPEKCDICRKTFYTKNELKRHLESHDTVKKYKCAYCLKFYQSRLSLQQHQKSHTCMFHCEICTKTFGSYSAFMAHKTMHDESIEGYQCEVCKKRIMSKGSLKRHMLMCHSQQRPYACTLCDKTYKTKKDLQVHYSVHADSATYTCSNCSFETKRQEVLRAHQRVNHRNSSAQRHGNPGDSSELQGSSIPKAVVVSVYYCTKCSLTFTEKCDCRTHFLSCHLPSSDGTEVTLYVCDECESLALSLVDLKSHVIRVHPDLLDHRDGETSYEAVTRSAI